MQHRYSINKVFVQESLFDKVMNKLVVRFGKMRYGNHMDKCNDYGPFADSTNGQRLREVIEDQKKSYGANVKQSGDSSSSENANVVSPHIITNLGLNCAINLDEANNNILLAYFKIKAFSFHFT
jgi:acyl-CoA reductase-like NAD-dependent aldehyde dehydrogenase